jgi:hypothetical protein
MWLKGSPEWGNFVYDGHRCGADDGPRYETVCLEAPQTLRQGFLRDAFIRTPQGIEPHWTTAKAPENKKRPL